MSSACKLGQLEATVEDIRNKYATDSSLMAKNVYKIAVLAEVIARDSTSDTMKSNFRNITNIRDGEIQVQDLLRSIYGTGDWKSLMKSNDKDIALAFETKFNQMLKLAVESGTKPAAFAESKYLTESFLAEYEPFIYAEKTDRFFQKALSGEFVRKFLPQQMQDDWDGLIRSKDKEWRRNLTLDQKRKAFTKVTDDLELDTRKLSDKIAKIFKDNPSRVLSPEQSNELLKYYDEELRYQDSQAFHGDSEHTLRKVMKEDFKIIEKEDLDQAVKDLDRVYSSWQEINYGITGDIPLKEGSIADIDGDKYNPRNYEGSVLGFMYKLGDNVVDQLLQSNLGPLELNDVQRMFLSKYGDIREKAIKEKFGQDFEIVPVQIRNGYVPMNKTPEIEEMLVGAESSKMFKEVVLFKERTRAHKESDPFQDSIVANIELLRFVGSDIAQYTFAQEVRKYTSPSNKEYQKWKDDRGPGNHEMEAGMYERYHKFILNRFTARTDSKRRNKSEIFQNVKKWTIAGMSLQGTMPLMDSAQNNVIQATMARFNTISLSQFIDFNSTTKASKASSDKNIVAITNRVHDLVEDKVRGRNADFVLHDVDMTVNSKALKAAFEIAEGSIRYGHLAPIAMGVKGLKTLWNLGGGNVSTDTSSMKDTKYFSMSGSEQWIRNFDTKVATNQMVAMYKAQSLENPDKFKNISDADLKNWTNEAMKSNQYYFARIEEELHGNFTKDTKPFSAYRLGDAETTSDLIIGLASAQFYMFRQATTFGLLGAVGSLGKQAGAAKHGKIHEQSAFAASIILADLAYEYYSDMWADNPIRFGALNAVNQIDPLLGGLEGLHAVMAPLFDLKVTQEQYDGITEKLARFGAGMVRGTLSEDENNKPFLEQIKGMLDLTSVAMRAAEPITLTFDMLTQGVNTRNAKDFKDRMRNRGTGWAPVDNILGPGNDFLRFFLKSTMTASAMATDGKRSEQQEQSYLRTNLMKSLLLGKLGFGFYTFDNETNTRINNASSYITQNNFQASAEGGYVKDRDAGNFYMDNYDKVDKQMNHLEL